jgi:hypothetical protein
MVGAHLLQNATITGLEGHVGQGDLFMTMGINFLLEIIEINLKWA